LDCVPSPAHKRKGEERESFSHLSGEIAVFVFGLSRTYLLEGAMGERVGNVQHRFLVVVLQVVDDLLEGLRGRSIIRLQHACVRV
jgi:hypothetical protein